MTDNVLKFRGPPRAATVGDRSPSIRERWTERLGRILTRVCAPGFIAPVEIEDKTTGQHITVTVGPLFTCLSINGRDFFFRRLTGRYDGAGMGCD